MGTSTNKILEINFDTLIVESFDKNWSGEVKGRYRFREVQTLKSTPRKTLGVKLRDFVLQEIKKGNLPYKEMKSPLYALVTDAKHGEISCLIKPEAIQ